MGCGTSGTALKPKAALQNAIHPPPRPVVYDGHGGVGGTYSGYNYNAGEEEMQRQQFQFQQQMEWDRQQQQQNQWHQDNYR